LAMVPALAMSAPERTSMLNPMSRIDLPPKSRMEPMITLDEERAVDELIRAWMRSWTRALMRASMLRAGRP
jgi:hypothetical protein